MANATSNPNTPAAAAIGAIWVTCGSSAVETAHRALDPFGEPALDGLGHRVEQLLDHPPLLRVEASQDEVGEVLQPSRHRPHPDAEARVVLSLERALDTLEPVVSARRARAPQARGAAQEPRRSDSCRSGA